MTADSIQSTEVQPGTEQKVPSNTSNNQQDEQTNTTAIVEIDNKEEEKSKY